MRGLLLFTLAVLAQAQEIGANFNHDPELIDIGLLQRTPVQWVRTTPYIFEYIHGQKSPETSPGLGNVVQAAEAGYRIAFGYRWDFRKHSLRIPAPGSETEKRYFDIAQRMLQRLGPHVSVFKLGNEPALETMDADMQPDANGVVPLVRFTERLLTEVVEPHYATHPDWPRPKVYVGSLPALFEPRMQRLPAVLGLIALAQESQAIEGLSIHLHIATEADMQESFRFVRERMPDKPLIVPEFSLHRLYVQHLREPLGATEQGRAFAGRYQRDPKMPLYSWYSLANQHQVSAEEWAAMFASRPWFPPHFLRTYRRYFEQYGVKLATYGFVSQYAPRIVPPDGMAWFINPIFIPKTLPPGPKGEVPANPLWFDDFIDIVNQGRPDSKARQ
ncbi:MAG: hypothetical protein JNK87_02595 [Bryobacterales bacterium]|nr:hypothetical protein [Bryobacterales bacterium]